AAVPQRPAGSVPPLVAAAAQATDTPASPPAPQVGIFGAELESPPAAPDNAATKATVVAPAVSRPKMPMPQPGIFGPPAGSAEDLPADSVARTGPATERPGPEKYSSNTAAVPQTVAARPVLSTAPQLTPEEDPPTVALRIPQKLLPRRSFREPPQRRRRELGAAAVAVSALVVVAAIGIGLGYGQHIFRQESTTVEGTTPPPASSATSPTARPGLAGASLTTAPEHESLAEPPPVAVPRETETPTTTTGPNTFQVPGLPPIVLPTIPPLFPPPPSR
ncbi:hypothetical protein ACLML9_17515, partial [Nocardia sp. NPDC002869]